MYGVLGFLEMKKLYIKLNVITNKLDEINEIISKEPEKTEETPKQSQPKNDASRTNTTTYTTSDDVKKTTRRVTYDETK